MFNNIYNSAKESYISAKATSGVVFNNFASFVGGAARPAVEGTVKTTAIVAAKTAIHTARFAHDAAIDLAKISYNVVKTGYNFAKTGQYDWAAGNWHASDKTIIITKPSNSTSEMKEVQDESTFSTFKNFVSKTWHVKDNSNLGQVAEELSHGTVFAKLAVDVACLAQSILWDGMIVTVAEGVADTAYKAGSEGYAAAEESQKDIEAKQQVKDLEFMDSVEDILGLNDLTESTDFTVYESESMGDQLDIPESFE